MLKRLAIWYLRKRKCSVLIGFDFTPWIIKPKKRNIYLFDAELNGVRMHDPDGREFNIPHGKFKQRYKNKGESHAD